MPFTKEINKDFVIQNNQIVLSSNYLETNKSKFKKITGSRFGSVLGLNDFSSSFKTWCMMVDIYKEPMDETLALVGNTIEPKIKNHVEKLLNQKFISYSPFEVKFDIFKDNKIFGGIPDGEPIIDGKINYSNYGILEIKTTSIDSFVYKNIDHLFILQKDDNNRPLVKSKGTKKAKWFDSNGEIIVPEEYKFQLGLYCYLKNINKGLFAICFLETDDYINPQNCDVTKRDIRIVEFNVDLNLFKNSIMEAEQWYEKHIISGISPEMNDEDKQLVKDLLGVC